MILTEEIIQEIKAAYLAGYEKGYVDGNPDEWLWECDCEKCQSRYKDWKAKYDRQQKELRE